jgi:ABC-2 type transport system ATP-binding protein
VRAAAGQARADTAAARRVASPTLRVVAPASQAVARKSVSTTTPRTPAEPALDWSLVALARRGSAAQGPITKPVVNPVTDGLITGNIGATDPSGLPLSYVVSAKPDQGATVTIDQATGNFRYLPTDALAKSGGEEHFSVLVSEHTAVAAVLQQIPLVGTYVPQLFRALQQVPVVNDVLAPVIGRATQQTVTVPVVADGTPLVRTVMVKSPDGTLINTYFFPASGLQPGKTAPTIFEGSGLGNAVNIDPNSQWDPFAPNALVGIAPLRANGYNVVTWDPRGMGASGGTLEFDSPEYEAKDTSAIIDWVSQQPEAALDGAGDPRMGMVGPSYGGGIQLVTAVDDHRIDAIVPIATWNSLGTSFYKNQAFKSSSTLLLLLTILGGSRLDPRISTGILVGDLTGGLTQEFQDLLAERSPGVSVSEITAPALLIQGTIDAIFTLQEADTTARILATNGIPTKMAWVCGGHGVCLTGGVDGALIRSDTLAWFDRYVKGDTSVSTGPAFEWVDQNGQYFSSDVLPSDAAFHGTPISATGAGGLLPIIPVIGGSGPYDWSELPGSIIVASKAGNALNLTVTAENADMVVGAPQLTMTYSGFGTSQHVFAQLVDDKTGLVLGNVVTPVPVTLDGQTHTISVPLEEVAQTMAAGDTLTLQIVGSATTYENLTSLGVIDVSSVQVTLPTVGAGAHAAPMS